MTREGRQEAKDVKGDSHLLPSTSTTCPRVVMPAGVNNTRVFSGGVYGWPGAVVETGEKEHLTVFGRGW